MHCLKDRSRHTKGCAKLESETVEQVTGVFTFRLQRIYAKNKQTNNPHTQKKTTTKPSSQNTQEEIFRAKGFKNTLEVNIRNQWTMNILFLN